ncbi:uncharacterized protein cubi_01881 [Cryptosporidium ubiquitum]|uniref:CAAX prenyl protease 2/Lysostaphin resistance protein A-like domain-containing protein n=1 Tax=Cryptosporidium ubiquitum TaxID=857276 RepID=A0A1J4MMD3_9CRYT|nr:uncharacterized protein cubi_01881 [Cryptosporidium ubiquitum]OII75360.1 hypothetical protein cubi_01881 [Cryptosporidium ubiquitum]
MISKFKNIQFIKILIVGILPCLNALFWLGFISNGLFAMYSMHFICMILVPTFCYGFKFLRSNLSDVIEYGKNFDIMKCIYICFFTSASGTACLFLLLEVSKIIPAFDLLKIEGIRDGLIKEGIIKDPKDGLSFFIWFSSIYFSIVNPIIEELFWRSFVYKELTMSLRIQNESNLRSNYIINEIRDNYSDFLMARDHSNYLIEKCQDIESGQINYKENTELASIISSALYSLYHFFVLIHFTSITFSALSTVSLAIAGRMLLYVSRKLDIIYSIYIHIGMDISIVLFLMLSLKERKI